MNSQQIQNHRRAWQRRLAQVNTCNRRARRNAARVLAWIEAHQS